jgi:beta-galactosidase GanA
MEKRGGATQLIVDGKPFLVLSGELANTAPTDLEYMQRMMPILANKVHLNTVLTAVAWAWIEPQEGKYDFHFVDAALDNANKCNLRIVWLWFGSWKNGQSNFAPTWVKANQDRFPKAQIRDGKSVEILSTLSENNVQADARALAALMRHVREVDKSQRVIMVQVENEVGLLGDTRDRSPVRQTGAQGVHGLSPEAQG